MAFYTPPHVGQRLRWAADSARTTLRFTADSIALLHFAAGDYAVSTWLKGTATVGIVSPLPDLPIVAAQVGLLDAIAAPACIFELGTEALVQHWLFAVESPLATPAEIHLVLLRPNGQPDEAEVVAVRIIGEVDELLCSLRGQLQDQYEEFGFEDAGFAQQAGRQLLVDNDPEALLLNSWPPIQG